MILKFMIRGADHELTSVNLPNVDSCTYCSTTQDYRYKVDSIEGTLKSNREVTFIL